jgi:uncharacterized membrane protein
MSQKGERPQRDEKPYVFNIALATVAGQVGCLTTLIVLVALLGGLWLDNIYQVRPTFTILLLVISIPVTLFVMLWVVRKTTARIQSNTERQIQDSQE